MTRVRHSLCPSSGHLVRVARALVIATVAVYGRAGVLAAGDPPPNIVMIAIDDLNDWVGCYGGHPQVKTPHLDALARRGVCFANAHCQAPICNPSRVSLLTGLRPSTTGVYFLGPLLRDAPKTARAETMFQTFHRAGYRTATMGKVFHGKLAEVDRESFDVIGRRGPRRWPKQKLSYDKPGSSRLWDWGAWYDRDTEVPDAQTAAWAAGQIRELAKSDRPFFLAVGFSLPHVPLYVPRKWFDLYPRDHVQLPAVRLDDLNDISPFALRLTDSGAAPRHRWFVEHHQWRDAVQAYLACVSFVDQCVGTVLQAIDESGVAENTLIVVWSDHGFHLGEKQRWAKRSLWEESTRSPLWMAGPGVAQGATCRRPVGLIDVYPTLLECCGLPPHPELEGQSLRPLLSDANAEWDRPVITTFGPNNHAVRSEHWRYIRYADGSEELYDHRQDPHEWRNLAGNPQYADVIAWHARSLPKVNAELAPGSSGSGTPLYREEEVAR